MATLTGFDRIPDPIHIEQLVAHVSDTIGKTISGAEVTPTEAIVWGATISETDRTAIQSAINSYSFSNPAAPAVSWETITGKPSTYTPSTHTHAQADISNLTTDLAGKAATNHNHDAAYSAIGHTHNYAATSHTHGVADLTATGTKDSTTFLRGDNTWAAPQGGSSYRNLVTLGSDVINNNAVANTLADVTGLSFSVTANTTYRFLFTIMYTAAATTTGSRWTLNGPATTLLAYNSRYSLTATTETVNYATAYGIPAASNLSSATTTGNIAIMEGIIRPSANGTVIARFASEVLNSAITAKAGSTLEWW